MRLYVEVYATAEARAAKLAQDAGAAVVAAVGLPFACAPCPLGTQTAHAGESDGGGVCEACPAGYDDHDQDASTKCQLCPPGRFSPESGSTCQSCSTIGGAWDHDNGTCGLLSPCSLSLVRL